MVLFKLAALSLATTLIATSAQAATFASRSWSTGCNVYDDRTSTTDGSAALTGGISSIPGCGLKSFSNVGAGFVSTAASGSATIVTQTRALATGSFEETFSITTPFGVNPNDPIPLIVGFATEALLFLNAPTNSVGQASGVASHSIAYSINGTNRSRPLEADTTGQIGWEAVTDGNNSLTDFVVSPGTIYSEMVFLEPANGVTIRLGAQTRYSQFLNAPVPPINGFADASNTTSFATEGPAFILPTGYFVNAPELGIVNNYWIDPRNPPTDPPVAVVPLPASLPLMLFGVFALGAITRRRHV